MDTDDNLGDAGLRCILRETEEEIDTTLNDPKLIGIARDPSRDVRTVPFSKVKLSQTFPALPKDTSDDEQIQASYGCPDYIYTGFVDESALGDTEELSGVRFIDIRNLEPNGLSAGHDVVVLSYREMLDSGSDYIPEGRLVDFNEDRQRFLPKPPLQSFVPEF